MFKTLGVFCGGSTKCDSMYMQKAFLLGSLLADKGVSIVYGGGNIGLMGAIADGAISKKGKIIGIIPQHLQDIEIGHPHITELHVVKTMHERKQKMFDLAEGFIVLPGGFGTLDEIFEVLTWKQLALHTKPICFFNQNGYWNGLKAMIQGMEKEKFIRPEHLEFFEFVDSEIDILPSLEKNLKQYHLQFVGHTDISNDRLQK
jgi:uncharacterized protein (TIGR00730 family)